jgi:hypothetical protein
MPYLCFIKHQTVKKKFERRTLEVHLLVFALIVDGFQWEALDRFSSGNGFRMPLVLIGWIQWWRFWRERKECLHLVAINLQPISIQVCVDSIKQIHYVRVVRCTMFFLVVCYPKI